MPRDFIRMLQLVCVSALIVTTTGAAFPQRFAAIAQKGPRALKADLDGDGAADTIKLTTTKGDIDEESFALTVNGVTVKRKLESFGDIDMQLVDVDSADKFKEIVIIAVGESDYTTTYVYRYDGTALNELLKLGGQGVDFSGNGIALQKEWMGFWVRKRKHQLDRATQRFHEVMQELYYVGIEGKVKETFPIYERRGAAGVVANTRAGSTLLVVACDSSPRCPADTGDACHWYLIKTESGLLGWARLETLRDKAELPWAG